MTRKKPQLSDSVDTCPHRTYRELIPGVMVCQCGINIDDTLRTEVQE